MNALVSIRRTLIPIGVGFLIALALALLLAVRWLNAPIKDITELMVYLLMSGAISLGLGAVAVLWLRRGRRRLWMQITLTYTVGVGIALLNVIFTARLMFSSAHDLLLLILLLLFTTVVSVGLGYALAQALVQRVTALHRGAQALTRGDLSTRVEPTGADEVAALAAEFNQMAARLEATALERERAETARRELMTAISHDLRTPLASLRALTDVLADGLVDDPATVARYMATMQMQIEHLRGLIDDLFELAQMDAGVLRLDRQPVVLSDLVSDTLEGMYPQAAAKGVQLAGNVGPTVGLVQIAPQKIERVVYNLVTNAIRHTPAGGKITIRAVGVPVESTIDAVEPQPSDWVLIEVADTGEGILPEDLPHVFRRFYRSEQSRSRATGGAGLGLAIARGIVEAHGGRIWAESVLNCGTRICFVLPRTEAQAATPPVSFRSHFVGDQVAHATV